MFDWRKILGKLLGGAMNAADATPLTGPAPLWWTVAVAAASAYAAATWGAPLCP